MMKKLKMNTHLEDVWKKYGRVAKMNMSYEVHCALECSKNEVYLIINEFEL